MGFFDLFKKRKPAPPPEPHRDLTWAERFARATQYPIPVLQQFLTELIPSIGGGTVKNLPESDEISVRGRLGELPVRVTIDTADPRLVLESKVEHGRGELRIYRDHSKVPKARADDDWADDDEIRVFIGKGVFIEGSGKFFAGMEASLQGYPPGFATWLAAEMERVGIYCVDVWHKKLLIKYGTHWNSPLAELHDPISQVVDGLQVLKTTSEMLAAAPAAGDANGAPERVECSYCSTRFLLGMLSHCPSCGAPYTG